MKTSLKKIYQDVSDGKLTQNEALEEIRVLKLQKEKKRTGTLLSAPIWETSNLSEISNANIEVFEQHHITLFELPNIDTQYVNKAIANCHSMSVQLVPQKNIAERYNEAAQNCFESVKSVLIQKPLGKILFQIVIPGNQKEILLVGLSGLLKSVSVENPNLMGQIVIVSSDISTADLAKLLETDKNLHQDKIIKYENGIRKVLRLKEIQTASKTPNILFKEKGTYIITGGLGGLGILIANEIANQTHDATIILAERSKLLDDKKKIIDSLLSRGIKVEYQQVDIGNLEQVKLLIKDIKSRYKQLNGIIHCAGINKDNFVLKKSTEELQSVLLPKVDGTYNLDEASKEIDLDFMVLFSSVASWFGNSGQTDYATANGFMDQFASYRNKLVKDKKRFGKTVSVNWPLWQEGGMKMDETTRKLISENTGLQSLETSKGIFSLYQSLELQHSQIVVMDGDSSKIRRNFIDKKEDVKAAQPTINKVSKEVGVNGLFEKTKEFITKELAVQLKIAPNQIDSRSPMEKYGIADQKITDNYHMGLEHLKGGHIKLTDLANGVYLLSEGPINKIDAGCMRINITSDENGKLEAHRDVYDYCKDFIRENGSDLKAYGDGVDSIFTSVSGNGGAWKVDLSRVKLSRKLPAYIFTKKLLSN